MERCGNTVLGNTDAKQDGASAHGCVFQLHDTRQTCSTGACPRVRVHTRALIEMHYFGAALCGGRPAVVAGMQWKARRGPELPADPSGVAVLQGLRAGHTLCPVQPSPKPRADERTRVHHACQRPSRKYKLCAQSAATKRSSSQPAACPCLGTPAGPALGQLPVGAPAHRSGFTGNAARQGGLRELPDQSLQLLLGPLRACLSVGCLSLRREGVPPFLSRARVRSRRLCHTLLLNGCIDFVSEWRGQPREVRAHSEHCGNPGPSGQAFLTTSRVTGGAAVVSGRSLVPQDVERLPGLR